MKISVNPSSYRELSSQPSANHPKKVLEKNSTDQMAISELQSIDTKVRAHEAAHLAAGGGVVSGGASFTYTKGPDGKMYATAGEVPIDASEGKTPQETIRKARQITAAALAPADPSPQDYKVAASAAMMEMRAQMEATKELQNTLQGKKAYGEAAADTSSSNIPAQISEIPVSA